MRDGMVFKKYKRHIGVVTQGGEFLKISKDPQICSIGEQIWFQEADIVEPGLLNKFKHFISNRNNVYRYAVAFSFILIFFSTNLGTYTFNAISDSSLLKSVIPYNKDLEKQNLAFNKNSLMPVDEQKKTPEEDDSNIGEEPAYAEESGLSSNNSQTVAYEEPLLGNNSNSQEVNVNSSDGTPSVGNNNFTLVTNSIWNNNDNKANSTVSDVTKKELSESKDVKTNSKESNNTKNPHKDILVADASNIDEQNSSSSNTNTSGKDKVDVVEENDPISPGNSTNNTDNSEPEAPSTSENNENNGITQPEGNKPDNTEDTNNSNTPDTSNLPPEYVAGAETGDDENDSDSQGDKTPEESGSENPDTGGNNNVDTPSDSNTDTDTDTDTDTNSDDNTPAVTPPPSTNVDMSATCEKDGYYYEMESILTFEENDQGQVVEVYKDMPIKKYCNTNNNNNNSSTDNESPSNDSSTVENSTNSSSEQEEGIIGQEEVPADEGLTFSK